jgi:hypothetical protein
MMNWGIEINDLPGRLRITIPPVGRVTALPGTYRVATIAWFAFAALIFASVATTGPGKDGDYIGIISPVAQFTIVGVIIFWMAWYRLHRQLTTELSDHWLSLLNRDGQPTRSWRRADLLEIKANMINGKLVVRAQDQEMRELFIGADRDMAVFVAEQLRAALARPIPPPTVQPTEPVTAQPITAPPPVTPFSSGYIMMGMAMAALALLTLIAVAFVSPTLAWILIGGCVLAAIPLGIVLGTQDKDIWI